MQKTVVHLTLVLLPPGVVSSNSSPSLKETSLFLKMLLVFMVITSPFVLIVTVGFARQPSFLLARPIPRNQMDGQIVKPIDDLKNSSILYHLLLWRRCVTQI